MARRVMAMVKITYLQMFAHSQGTVQPPREDLAVLHANKPPVAYYRFLYDAVGREYDWTSRRHQHLAPAPPHTDDLF